MIRNWNEFDNKLREAALIDVAVTEAGRVRDLALIEAETEFKAATAVRLAARATIEKELEKFYRANRREVEKDGKRSVELIFGRAGIRATAAMLKPMKGVKWPEIVERIKAAMLEKDWRPLIKSKETVDKEAVKKAQLAAEKLAVLGLTIKASEKFFFETFPEKLQAERPQ